MNFEKRKTTKQLKEQARSNWNAWRVVFESRGSIDYQTVFGKPYMTPQDIMEANYALDMYIEAQQKAIKSKKK